ncbi:MAG TPA: 4-alpha-glucanotransferase, partial [Rhizomicrobium sp.]|nr:4-alpha-glucanotransferase [Rhizomicrobium sp.]
TANDEAVIALAAEAGLDVRWTGADGKSCVVAIDTLASVLRALGLPAGSHAEVRESRTRLRMENRGVPALIAARAGETVRLPKGSAGEINLASGARRSLRLRDTGDGAVCFRAPSEVGYHRIELDGRDVTLAVAPGHCVRPDDIVAHSRLAGLSAQIYALRGGTSGAFGDFAALGAFAKRAGRMGFEALMTSPVHAQFGVACSRFSPYSPSTRFFLNPLFADATLEGGEPLEDTQRESCLIDWPEASSRKHQALRAAFARFRKRGNRSAFEHFCRDGGERLLSHALFEALGRRFRSRGNYERCDWPAGFSAPGAPGVREFAHSAREDVEFQLFLQWITACSAAAAQKAARQTMAIGIVSDIAVGMDPQGSHAWSAPQELLQGLRVGAPPDAFASSGQDWGLTTLCPRTLRASAYAPFIATLRAAMHNAGGIRIDHALGLRRMWVLPAGASSVDGVYLRYPQPELLRLAALESHLHRAIVIGEDLGTVPGGFRDDLADAGVLGTQVLWFERDRAGRFTSPRQWRRNAVATTTTHDLATIAGWWSENDIDWQVRIHRLDGAGGKMRDERAADRGRLWSALKRAKCVTGSKPERNKPDAVVTGALAFVGRTRRTLALAPVEDIAGEVEQANLPGTIDEHPNWRRRMKRGDFFRNKRARASLKAFVAARQT